MGDSDGGAAQYHPVEDAADTEQVLLAQLPHRRGEHGAAHGARRRRRQTGHGARLGRRHDQLETLQENGTNLALDLAVNGTFNVEMFTFNTMAVKE